MRTDLRGNPSFREVIRRVREVVIGAHTHQELPFERLVEELQPERSLSHSPIFQVWFVLQNAPMGRLELPGLAIIPLGAGESISKFDLVCSFTERGDTLAGAIYYSAALFDDETITEMAQHFKTLIEEIVANPDERILDIPLAKEDFGAEINSGSISLDATDAEDRFLF
jgi:non-ribosomal peptide synthetase component F